MPALTFLLERVPTPLGEMLVVTDEQGLLRALDWHDHEARMQELMRRQYPGERPQLRATSQASSATQAMRAYFEGDIGVIHALAVATGGTPFQRQVWAALRAIPDGQTISYGELAQRIGNPTALRVASDVKRGTNRAAARVLIWRSGELDVRARLGAHLFLRHAGRQLEALEALGRHVEHAQLGDDAVDHTHARQRQRALLQQLVLAVLGRVLHEHHDALDAGHQVHGATHALDHLARDHPVGQVPLLGHLHGAQDGQVDLAASDHREAL